jgi:septum formation protein
MHQLILASQSPRRHELLTRAGYQFTVTSLQISEIPDENLNLPDQIRKLALEKAEACINSGKISKKQGILVLAADTVVVLDNQILGKPRDIEQCEEYLRRLSGSTHMVITGVCICEPAVGRVVLGHETSYVTFRQLSEKELLAYAHSGDGLDKAGGYGIQAGAGSFVAKVEGPEDNVVGLPIKLVEKLLAENDWQVEQRPPLDERELK